MKLWIYTAANRQPNIWCDEHDWIDTDDARAPGTSGWKDFAAVVRLAEQHERQHHKVAEEKP
jgi:hypothetical protein